MMLCCIILLKNPSSRLQEHIENIISCVLLVELFLSRYCLFELAQQVVVMSATDIMLHQCSQLSPTEALLLSSRS